MSHEWGLRCVQCRCEAGGINHGEDTWTRVVLHVWPLLRPVWESMRDEPDKWPWEVKDPLEWLCISNNQRGGEDDGKEISIWDWLLKHADHGIELCSEYESEPSRPLLAPRPLFVWKAAGECFMCERKSDDLRNVPANAACLANPMCPPCRAKAGWTDEQIEAYWTRFRAMLTKSSNVDG